MADDQQEPSGKAKGGVARAKALSSDARQSIARKAALARWGLSATHKGNFKDDFGLDVDCYVLNDEQKTAVVSQRGMAVAIGLSERGTSFTRFASSKAIAPYFGGAELQEKIANPIKFQWGVGGAGQPPSEIHGYDVTLLIDVCKAIVAAEADGKLSANQSHLAKQAHIILNGSAKAGIKHVVYALAGYDASRAEIIAAYKFYVREEARDYEKEFPDDLYLEWYRLYDLPKPEKNKPWKFKSLTLDHVYHPLAKSNGKILELVKLQRSSGAERHRKLHQFLSDVGVKALRTHLGRLLGIAQFSEDKAEYERKVRKAFGDNIEMDV